MKGKHPHNLISNKSCLDQTPNTELPPSKDVLIDDFMEKLDNYISTKTTYENRPRSFFKLEMDELRESLENLLM